MIRISTEQIDRGILDAAARTFALHGYAKTSVQQLADAVGYSKTGLLHRFASKQILYTAAVEAAAAEVEAVLAAARTDPDAVAILKSLTERALDGPGLVALLAHAAHPTSTEPGHERLNAATEALIGTLCAGRADEDGTLRLRVVLALDLIVAAVGMQDQAHLQVDRSRLQPLVAALAADVLSGPRPSP